MIPAILPDPDDGTCRIERHMTWARRIEHQADGIAAMDNGRTGIFGAGDTADFDAYLAGI